MEYKDIHHPGFMVMIQSRIWIKIKRNNIYIALQTTANLVVKTLKAIAGMFTLQTMFKSIKSYYTFLWPLDKLLYEIEC